MAKKSKLQKMQSIQAKCQHEKTEIRKMNSLRFNLCLNCGHKELIEDLIKVKIPEKNHEAQSPLTTLTNLVEKKPKAGSMLDIVLHSFPAEGEFTMDEILKLVRQDSPEMQSKKDSSLRTVFRELVKEPEPQKGKASPHINRYACLFSEDGKKFRRI